MENEEQIFIGKKRRLIIQQEIGFGKVLDAIREKYEVKVLVGNNEEIILIENLCQQGFIKEQKNIKE